MDGSPRGGGNETCGLRHWKSANLFVLATTACSGTVAPQPTYTPYPTYTPFPTQVSPTATVEPTKTPEPTATLTPTPDLRVYDFNPYSLLATKDDIWTVPELKADGYYIPNSTWIERLTNGTIVSQWTVSKGTAYLVATGRIEGWIIAFDRGNTTFTSPGEIDDNVVLFRTHDGAMTMLNQYGNCKSVDSTFAPVKTTLAVGDATNECQHKVMQSGGDYQEQYVVEFVNRNVVHTITSIGWEKETVPDLLEKLAVVLNAKLNALPLSTAVTYQP